MQMQPTFIVCVLFSVLLSLVPIVNASACTLACDALFPISPEMVDICGTDGEDHTVPVLALVSLHYPWSCYRDCGVGVLYSGTCKCPNNCYESSSKGKCAGNNCICASGWGGVDCSAIECPNSCSNNGNCISSNSTADSCVCNEGFTGLDCSVPLLTIPALPYGEVFSGQYYFNDSYADNHPVFNLSVLGNFNMQMDPADYATMLAPVDTWNQSYFHANGTFNNGIVSSFFPKAGIKIKGNHARVCTKKSFIIEMERKDKTSFSFYGLSEIALKAPAFDLSYMHNQLIVEFYRAMMVPVSRGSFGTLTINGVFWGLFWLNEEIDSAFALSRFGTDSGDMYQINTYLEYLGDNGEAYENVTYKSNGGILPAYKEQFGDGTFNELAAIAKFLNETSDEQFQSQIEQTFNVDAFIRSMVVEATIDLQDGYTHSSSNWALFDCPVNNSWQFISHDYEWTMIDPLVDAYKTVTENTRTLLSHRILLIPKYHDIFSNYFRLFLKKVLDPSLPNSAKSRVSAMTPFLKGIIGQDKFYSITNGFEAGDDSWELAVYAASEYLSLRYDYLKLEFSI